ncbi:hypothetical protein ARSEF4850_010029, partial [Beauveria asiatica]
MCPTQPSAASRCWLAFTAPCCKGHIARLYLNQSSSDPEWGKNYEG